MIVHYRIFDVHEPLKGALAEGTEPFRHVVGDVIYVGFDEYTVVECRMQHIFDHHKRDKDPSMGRIDLMCRKRET